jgi:hypothetical protein
MVGIQSEQSGPVIDLNVCGGQCTLNPVTVRHRKQSTGYGTYSVQPLLDLLNRNFAAALHPPRNMTVDETMVAYRGKHESFILMPGKPIDRGIDRGFKIWTLSDLFGYVYHQMLYVGKSDDTAAASAGDVKIMHRTVVDLIGEYLGDWRVITMDSAFTTKPLIIDLLEKQTLAIGKCNPAWSFPFQVKHAALQPNQWCSVQNKNPSTTLCHIIC